MINNVTLGGKVVSEVELRRSKSNTSVLDFRLMSKNPRRKEPVYIDIEVWGNEAERFSQNAKRGSRCIVHGELRRDVWDKDGETRSKIKITANRVQLVAETADTNEEKPSF